MEKKDPFKISVADIVIFVAVSVVTLVVIVSAIVRFVKGGGADQSQDYFARVQSAFSKMGEDAIGTEYLPEQGILTYDTASGTVRLYDEEYVSFLSGYHTEKGFRIRVGTADGTRLLAAYSTALEEDYKKIRSLPVTFRADFTTEGIERDFIRSEMARLYENVAFLDGARAFVYTAEEEREISSGSGFGRVIVCSALNEESLAVLKRFSAATQIDFSDLGDYSLISDVLFDRNEGILVYALPCATDISCPASVYGMEKGCLQNAVRVKTMSIPYTGKSVSYLFGGKIPESLKKITFTSSLTGEVPAEALEGCEAIEIAYAWK